MLLFYHFLSRVYIILDLLLFSGDDLSLYRYKDEAAIRRIPTKEGLKDSLELLSPLGCFKLADGVMSFVHDSQTVKLGSRLVYFVGDLVC